MEVGKKYNARTLRSMRQLYYLFKDEIWKPVVSKLSWTLLLLLMPLKDKNIIYYYANQTINNNLSKRQLQELIKSHEYERLPEETKNKLIKKEEVNIKDLVPNPIIIRNKNNIDVVSEKVLHTLIMEDIESFMKGLGVFFSFIGSEYKIKIGDTYHSIDLLLFNIKYNAYVVVELKITKFKVEYISQTKKYMNYIDKNIKEITNDDTIGIIVCKKEDKFVMEYSSDDRIMIREFAIN